MVRYKNRYGVFCVRLDRDDEKKHVVLSGRDVYYAIQVRLFFFSIRFRRDTLLDHIRIP